MTSLTLMNQEVTRQVGGRISKFCSPLVAKLGISHFYHFILTSSGQYACAGLHHDWHECWFSGDGYLHTPYYRNPRLMHGGLLFAQTIQQEEWQRWMRLAAEKYNVHLSLQIMTKTSEGMDVFGFALNTPDPLRHMALINQLPLLNLFISQYKKEFNPTVLKDNFADLGSLLGPSFNKPSETPHMLEKTFAHVTLPFTDREEEVIRQLLNGSTAPMIAEKLSLSTRTVEHHLERLKQKFDCPKKADLIQKLKQYESMGYLF